MDENAATNSMHHLDHHQVFETISIDVPSHNASQYYDDDGRLKRTGIYIRTLLYTLRLSPNFIFALLSLNNFLTSAHVTTKSNMFNSDMAGLKSDCNMCAVVNT